MTLGRLLCEAGVVPLCLRPDTRSAVRVRWTRMSSVARSTSRWATASTRAPSSTPCRPWLGTVERASWSERSVPGRSTRRPPARRSTCTSTSTSSTARNRPACASPQAPDPSLTQIEECLAAACATADVTAASIACAWLPEHLSDQATRETITRLERAPGTDLAWHEPTDRWPFHRTKARPEELRPPDPRSPPRAAARRRG
jgi:hypothetical protein